MVQKRRRNDDSESESEFEDDNESGGNASQSNKRTRVDVDQAADEVLARGQALIGDRDRRAGVEERMERANVGSETEPFGVMKSCTLEDFMCHAHLVFKFNPRLNFVTGQNGSGKSAVLTALTIVLGGKTTSTGRASSMAQFIKTGADRAKISLVLHNGGPDAFGQKENYGKEITIERVILANGGGTWNIKGADGKVRSQKKKTLTEICDHMNIQVDNPMTVLTQDQSRSFLSSSDPGVKYKLFLLGTQLHQLAQEYSATLESVGSLKKDAQIIQESLPEIKAERKAWKKRYDQLEAVRGHKERLKAMRQEAAWAHVQDKGQEVAAAKSQVEITNKKAEEVEAKLAEATDSHRIAEEAVTAAETGLANYVRSLDARAAQAKVIEANWKAVCTDLGEQQRSLNKLTEDLNINKAKEDSLRVQRQAQIDKQGDNSLEQERVALEKTIAGKKALLEKMQIELDVLATNRASAVQEREQLEARKSDLAQARLECSSNLTAATRLLTNLKNPQGSLDPLHKYGKNLAAVMEEINKRKWIGKKPSGPLGTHVKIKAGENAIRPVIETLLNSQLRSWAVSDGRDGRQLEGIFHDCIKHRGAYFEGGIPNIINSSTELFDFSKGDLNDIHPTILSKLEITDDWVIRILINAAYIERVFMTKTLTESNRMSNGLNQKVKKRAQEVGLPLKTVIVSEDRFKVEVRPAGNNYSTQVGGRMGPQALLSMGAQADLTQAEENEKNLKSEFQATQSQFDAVTAQIRTQVEAIGKIDARVRYIEKAQNVEKPILAQLERKRDDMRPAAVDTFDEMIQECIEERTGLVEQSANLEIEKAAKAEEKEVLSGERREHRRLDNAQRQEVDEQRSRVEQLAETRLTAATNIQHYKGSLKRAQGLQNQAEQALLDVETVYKDWRQKAVRFCHSEDEVEVTQSSAALDAAIKTLQANIARRPADQQYDLETVEAKLAEVVVRLESLRRKAADISNIADQLEKSVKDRMLAWERLRSHVSVHTKTRFEENLMKRGFTGEMHLDHVQQKLTLKVQTDPAFIRDADDPMAQILAKDPLALSGGETSFTTICLLLALWESVHCPIRCLDEFDVFMDAANRKLAMNMLVEAAKANLNYQYIMISPQGMSDIVAGPDVRIHRMPDPARGLDGLQQTRLNFQSA